MVLMTSILPAHAEVEVEVTFCLSSTVHQIGFDVEIHTTGSDGSRWLEVDTIPSNEESQSAVLRLCPYV